MKRSKNFETKIVPSFCLIIVLLLNLFIGTGCSNQENGIVIYTSMEEDRNQALKEEIRKKFPDLNIKVQYMSTGNSAAKIKSEGKKIEADIIVDLETAHMENLKEHFADLSAFDTSQFLEDVIVSNTYYPWTNYALSLFIDKEYFEKKGWDPPKTYEDLLDVKYKNLIAMPDPKTSGTGYAFFLNVVNSMGEEKAIDYFKELKGNLREFTSSGSGPTNLLKQGEIAIALGMISQGVSAINEGYAFEIVSLETGVPYNGTSIGIISGKENKEHVKEVFEYLLNDFNKLDKENYLPSSLFKEQTNKVKNYPTDLKYADMTGIDDIKTKEHLNEIWSEING